MCTQFAVAIKVQIIILSQFLLDLSGMYIWKKYKCLLEIFAFFPLSFCYFFFDQIDIIYATR